MIISFAWTTGALLAGEKTVTRRAWDDAYARRWVAGSVHEAYDRSPRAGGRRVGRIRLTRTAYKERLADMPDDHFRREGGTRYWPSKAAFVVMMGGPEVEVWVIEFKLLAVDPPALPADGQQKFEFGIGEKNNGRR